MIQVCAKVFRMTNWMGSESYKQVEDARWRYLHDIDPMLQDYIVNGNHFYFFKFDIFNVMITVI